MKSLILSDTLFFPVVLLDYLVKIHLKLPHLSLIFAFIFLDIFNHVFSHALLVVNNIIDQLVTVDIEELVTAIGF
jgi:hypothetical protein